METFAIRSDRISATIKSDGAELCSLKNAEGLELLWQAGQQWPRHAPVLFPIVGRLKNDQLRHRGKAYPMTQHGFARDHRFSCLQHEPAFCQLVLIDDPETLSRYPFPFRLEITYTVTGADLEVALQITNTGDENMPASIGAHPAFNWPLQPGLPKEDYRLTFSDNEIAPVRRLKDGLMRAKPEPTPIQGKTLALSERLFDDDAVILDKVASRESDVKAVTGKVALGQADAGFVYVTDARPVSDEVSVIRIPAWAQPRVRYEIAVVSKSPNKAAARAWVKMILSAKGQAALRKAGFLPLPKASS